MGDPNMTGEIQSLIGDMLGQYSATNSIASMSCNVYDTSWLACLSKRVSGQQQWVFPKCFEYVLERQLPNGGWSKDVERTSAILTTMAALHSIVVHIESSIASMVPRKHELKERRDRAVVCVRDALTRWHVQDAVEVGIELILPRLVDLLEDKGIRLDFPSRDSLWAMKNAKLRKIDPSRVLTQAPSPLMHSLEAFHGDTSIDFQGVGQWKFNGSIMASPAATAAYLMNIPEWDEEAELYLHGVLKATGRANWGVPSAFPTTIFECSWVCQAPDDRHVRILRCTFRSSQLLKIWGLA